jgi:hypothetical protein
MYVKFVRQGAGGVGEYVALKPMGYDGPTDPITKFTPGVIPANSKYTTGTSVGFNPDDYKTAEDLQRIATKLASGQPLTIDEQAFLNKGVTATAAPTAAPTPAPVAPTAAPTVAKTYSPEELQRIITKLTSGGTLTAEEKEAIGMGSTPTPAPTPSVSVTPKPSPTPTPSVSGTPTPSPTPSVSGTPTPTPTVSGTPTPTPSVSGITTTAPLLIVTPFKIIALDPIQTSSFNVIKCSIPCCFRM